MAFGIPSWVAGTIPVTICEFIFMGGVDRLASVTEKLAPVMAAFFLIGGLGVFVVRSQYTPDTFGLIFKYAFRPQATIGGRFGMTIKTATSQGAKGGLFSDGAGVGSTLYVHVLAAVKNPHEQGCVTMVGAYYLFVFFCIVHNFWSELICKN